MMMLLGSACSEVTESLAKVVPYWNIVQVGALINIRNFPKSSLIILFEIL